MVIVVDYNRSLICDGPESIKFNVSMVGYNRFSVHIVI